MVRDRDGRLKGFGSAEFTSVKDLVEALKLNKMVCVRREGGVREALSSVL